MRATSIPIILPIFLAAAVVLFAKPVPNNRVTEVFRLSRVGKANAAETRELLVPLYTIAAKEYDAEIEKRRETMEKIYRGHQVRILRVLTESDGGDPIYLCAYAGELSVFSIPGEKRREGELTPALKIEENGTHETSVTRVVSRGTGAGAPNGKPGLEVVDDSGGGAVSFFGIPLVFDDGPSPRRAEPAGQPAPQTPRGEERKEVTETKSYPKYRAAISTELIEEGPPPMSTELFLELIKNGKVFTAKSAENRRCQECRGFGRVTSTRPVGQRDPDGKMPCPDCKGAGARDWQVTYLMTW